MANLLIIGAGGVSQVATYKAAANCDVFSKITLASRTKSKCDKIAKFIKERLGVDIQTAQIDADDTDAVVSLIKKTGAEILSLITSGVKRIYHKDGEILKWDIRVSRPTL